ncbi:MULTISPECIES: dihydrolipoamide acetyltransferase family protein [unclassified Streptomyces]|uniref:dihydrolipoamide acetyltransferase family protein n=1 Tax=unclassified Streptomyces TaxID=2593676 RepID=UPI001905183D|nr:MULTISPECIES: dihydrolipoamide acetyltransferase family protein [unclassified Streptomyces]MCU4747770.1 2-oxo acid dehydrogenase subunit E2 [Streptomyces sp. G-5]QQN78395.1 2-oxo acid dehydrogenase subunit E2 [Streptomyces sp. XC 2026]
MAAVTQRYREFKMPDVGEGLTEAEILKWHVQPGDTVSDGQVVVEVETAKAAVELPIPFDGTVHELLWAEGDTVDVGSPIITVDTTPGEPQETPAGAAPEPAAAGPAPAPEQPQVEPGAEKPPARQPVLVGYGVSTAATKRRPRKAPAAAVPEPAAAPEQAPAPASVPASVPAAGGKPLAKPPVRKLAKDLGIDLRVVRPTGPEGTITREDVQAAAVPAPQPAGTGAVPEPERETQAAAPVPAAGERRVPIRGVRKATAQAVAGSAFTAPHVTEFITVDVTRTMKLVARLKEDPDLTGVRVNPLLIIARALLLALRRNPDAHAAWDEANQEIVYKDAVNLGIAAATPRGLLVPNIKDAGRKTLTELATAIGELVTTAREGRTTPADMQGGTVTITNVGVFGVDSGTPILNPGESAILAVGAIKAQPWVHKGKVKPRQVTTLALSFDHRLIDGELGSRLLADIAGVLEHPRRLLTWG